MKPTEIKMNLSFLRLSKIHKSLNLNHKDSPVIINFTPTQQPVGSVVTLIGGRRYKVHETGAWIRQD